MSPITDSSPSWRDPDHPTAHDRFRHIFRDHWHHWCDLRLEDEVPAGQRAYARNVKRKLAPTVHAALEVLRLQFPLFDMEALAQTFQHLKWRERIKQSFGCDPLECPCCGCIMQLAEIWDPKRGHIWMWRWLETHRMRRAARQALERMRAQHHRYRQLAFDFNFDT